MNQNDNNLKSLSVALWAANYGIDCWTEQSWMACAKRQIYKASDEGASLLIMPEWLSEMWNKFGPYQGDETLDRIKWEADTAERLLSKLGRIAKENGLALLAGTAPALSDDQETWTNRARLFLTDGRIAAQDKIFFTPSEKSLPGGRETQSLQIIEWDGRRIAIAICLDSESPAICTHLRQANIDLLLVPSLTGTLSGYNRVCTGTKARAMELMCPVATVGSIGVQTVGSLPLLKNISGASVYVPCELEFSNGSGILSSTGLIDSKTVKGDGVLFIVRDIPIDRCRELRANSAEVWSRDHVGRVIEVSAVNIEGLHRNTVGRNGSVIVPG